MTCILPPELDDYVLLTYLDGYSSDRRSPGNDAPQVAAHLRQCPYCREKARRLARELSQRNREVGTILKRLEGRGLIYSRRYTWRGPYGAVRELRAYFLAGMADGQALPGLDVGPDLPTRAALRGLETAAAHMVEFADVARMSSPRAGIRRRVGQAEDLALRSHPS